MRYDSTSAPEKYHSSRALASADVNCWMSLVREVIPHQLNPLLIDLGCGTGRFTTPLAEQLGIPVIGVDPSRKMLLEAARNISASRVEYREGGAESIPLDANSATLLFMSNAIHHVKRLDEALLEMRRVLRPNGVVFIRNYSLENLASLKYLRFFPEAMQTSRDMLWSRRKMVERFTAGGFATLSQGTVCQESATDFASYLGKIENRVYSDLVLISDEAFNQGVARMKDAGASLGGGPILEEVDYFVFQK
jgi:ubiquinone/menaquinone biosynthesis C-methylase UbiE